MSTVRLRKPEALPEGGFDFQPFKVPVALCLSSPRPHHCPRQEDFEFIVRKLREEREAPPAATDAVLELDAVPPPVYGQAYSILERAEVDEAYEARRRSSTLPRGRVLAALTLAAVCAWLLLGPAPPRPRPPPLWWAPLTRRRRSPPGCRRTRGGRRTVVDSRGVQCAATAVGGDGCCGRPVATTGHCASCRERDGCCGSYEDCVQCCMVEDHQMLLRLQVREQRRLGARVESEGWDPFSVCEAVCRTSSRSLDKHNQYRDATHHHCYLLARV